MLGEVGAKVGRIWRAQADDTQPEFAIHGDVYALMDESPNEAG